VFTHLSLAAREQRARNADRNFAAERALGARTRRERASLLSCVGELLKRSVLRSAVIQEFEMRLMLIELYIGSSLLLTGCVAKLSTRRSETSRPSESLSLSDTRKRVHDDKTAISIAVVVWSSSYGARDIEEEKPYKAELEDGVWKVRSSLSKIKKGAFSNASMSEADIAQENGRVLRISHPTFTF
jgi:hypothetical protein